MEYMSIYMSIQQNTSRLKKQYLHLLLMHTSSRLQPTSEVQPTSHAPSIH